MATNAHTRSRAALPAASASFLAAMALALGVVVVAAPRGEALRASTGAYGWPVKPFDRPHPVRGSFGDPRTIFDAPPTMGGLLHGGGDFSFHQGVDISAENGTAVYPVVSGYVTAVTHEWVRISSGGGRAFEYWHVRAAVHLGERVTAFETVLGRVKRPAAHVHLTELRNGRAVNPLRPGHLTPYRDTTAPAVTSIAFRGPSGGPELFPSALRGRVVLVAAAEDAPVLPALRHWRGLPVTPALLKWRVERWDGRVVLRDRVAVDYRTRVPGNGGFWRTYARGTFQNMAVFGKHYSWGQRGAYLFRLTPRAFDTRRLRDDVYDLVVTAVDIAGNRSSLAKRFTVDNSPRR